METKNMPINIVIVTLSGAFSQKVASSLSQKLEMLSVDCHQMIVYDLINPQEVLDKAGIEYFKRRERGVVKNCSEFLNTVVSIDFNLFYEYKNFFNNSLVFFLKLPCKLIDNVAGQIAQKDREEKIKEISISLTLEKRSSVEAVKKILNKMGEMYENC